MGEEAFNKSCGWKKRSIEENGQAALSLHTLPLIKRERGGDKSEIHVYMFILLMHRLSW